MHSLAVLLPLVLLATHAAPKTGADLVRQMHARYAGNLPEQTAYSCSQVNPGP